MISLSVLTLFTNQHKKGKIHTYPLNLNPHIIPMLQHNLRIPHRPDPRRRPRHDERSPLQRRPLRQKRNHVRDAEDHFLGARVLYDVAVVDGFDAEGVRVRDVGLRDEEGADGRGGVEA